MHPSDPLTTEQVAAFQKRFLDLPSCIWNFKLFLQKQLSNLEIIDLD